MSRVAVVGLLFALVLVTLPLWLRENIGRISQQGRINPTELTGNYDPSGKVGVFEGQTFQPPSFIASNNLKSPKVLGSSYGEKRIEVDLTHQRLYAYEGSHLVYDFLISSGKWHYTPTGTFRIWTKLRYTLMTGGSKLINTYYYLPNVPYVMYFAGGVVSEADGYGLHGTYWHHNFGHPMSHGCINMETDQAGLLYQWTDPSLNGQDSIRATDGNLGTEIVIYGVTPES